MERNGDGEGVVYGVWVRWPGVGVHVGVAIKGQGLGRGCRGWYIV